jgi:AraC-like DNA-binding protein
MVLKNESFVGSGKEFFVNSALNGLYASCRLEVKLEDDSEVSMTYAEFPHSLLSKLKFSGANHMLAPRADDYFLIVVLDGRVKYRIDQHEMVATPGDLIIANQGQSVERWTGEEGMEVLILKLSPDNFRRMLHTVLEEQIPAEVAFHNFLPAENPRAGFVRRCLEYAFNELQLLADDVRKNSEDDLYYRALLSNIEGYMMRSLLITLRKDLRMSEILEASNQKALPRYLVDALKYINTHIQDTMHMGDFAQLLGVSQRSLSAAFKTHIGVSPKQYIKALRLDGVHEELKQLGRDASVTDVATRWGFSQLGWFAAEYKKRFGESPSETARCMGTDMQ